jgi:hypothetical protein
MTKVVMINKGGSIKTQTVKNLKVSDLYKKCKFRKPDDFDKRHTWKYKNKWVSVYAKNKGRANSENKYDLPPPIDTVLYFGNLLIIMHDNQTPVDSEVCDFDKETWLKVYEKLLGGFEDLSITAQQDDEEEDELESVSPSQKTKEGYLKDGFVVSDDIEDEEDSDYECPSEEESGDENTDNECEDEDDDEANYGGETDDEEKTNDDDEEEEEESDASDDDPASELSEEEYSY